MEESVVAIAGDLILEKQRLSDIIRRVEANPKANDADNLFDQMRSALDRISQMSKTLIYIANSKRSVEARELLATTLRHLEVASGKFVKPVQVNISGASTMFEKQVIEKIRPLIGELIDSCIEFGVESSRERMARKKTVAAHFTFAVAPDGDGNMIDLRYDGNGLEPPVSETLGENLAWIGASAEFHGIPGMQSRWRLWIPSNTGPISAYTFAVDGRTLCVPKFNVERMITLSDQQIEESATGLTWCSFGESLSQFFIDPRFPGNYGDAALIIRSGLRKIALVVKSPLVVDDVFVRPLDAKLNANGRFLGVISPDGTNNLALVVNAAHLVYGKKSDARVLSENRERMSGDAP